MDNFSVQVICSELDTFEKAFRMAFDDRKATHYRFVELEQRNYGRPAQNKAWSLIFYWTDNTGLPELPFPMDTEAALTFARSWVKQVQYPQEPDHDGDNEKGYCVSTGDFWGHLASSSYSICMVQPCWALLGK